jgi:hypothetical protein
MACILTSGRSLPCKSSVGGLKNVYFADYNSVSGVTPASGPITAWTDTNWYKYEIKGNSSLETAINSSRENGTTFYESTLSLTLTTIDQATQEQIKLLAHGRPYVAVEDYNGNIFVMGLENGSEVTGGTIVTGSAMGDLSGFTLTMTAQEKEPPRFLDGETLTVSAQMIDPNA